jgi:hypothetical protein
MNAECPKGRPGIISPIMILIPYCHVAEKTFARLTEGLQNNHLEKINCLSLINPCQDERNWDKVSSVLINIANEERASN